MNAVTPVIETSQLSKTYHSGKRETLALNDLSLTVNRGEIFGYLGPNGAGKTTTIRLLLDLIRPTRGSAALLGMDARLNALAIHGRIGFLPSELNLWKSRTAEQVVHYFANVHGNASKHIHEAHQISDRLKLDLTKKVRDYSTGNRRKLGLVLALMHRPELLILDEPTSGLDPLVQQTFNQMMREVRNEGRTVFLSSHILSEVQAICDRVGILRDGELKAVENVEHLTHVDFRKVTFEFKQDVAGALTNKLTALDGVSGLTVNDMSITFKLVGDFDPVIRQVSDLYIKDIRIEEPTLEEIFLSFYGAEA